LIKELRPIGSGPDAVISLKRAPAEMKKQIKLPELTALYFQYFKELVGEGAALT